MLITTTFIIVFGGILFSIFLSMTKERSSYIKLYPKVSKIQTPYFGRLEYIYKKDGDNIFQGDTILRVLNLESNEKKYVVSQVEGNLILLQNFKEGQILEANTTLGTVMAKDIEYKLLGKISQEEIDGVSDKENMILCYDTILLSGKTVGVGKNNDFIVSIPLDERIVKALIEKDSVSMLRRRARNYIGL